ncbi:hypothetical protein FHETE_8306 [Fusarium heterosporum]|uniref:USP domain-containing protein n=1 Tax=Fusarium heterosporum TaxID=42747 RepID=A0A8H5T2E3_FUSHE|nr:hypothetical protein FHETE_8306 [Fusarium heterosporum]
MDPASTSLDSPDRAASAEANSTRPNPFDDGDISSRKRRRTSLSGSPADSLDTVNPILDSSSSTTLDTDPVLLQRGSAAGSPPDPVTPKTPGTGTPVCDSHTEPPSSMVTLNLRNVPQDDSSSPPPCTLPQPQPADAKDVTDAVNEQVKESVEDSEPEMAPVPSQGLCASRSSLSRSPSPPIEVIAIQSDEDMLSDRQSVGVSIIEDDTVLIDPIHEFPFKESTETLEGMVTRLSNYLANQPYIEASVIYKLHQWLDQYLDYVASSDWKSVADSCHFNSPFWLTFPRIVSAMARHKPPLYEEESLHEAVKAFLIGFARLSAWFVSQDIRTLKEYAADQATQNQRPFDLFSPRYLTHLHHITQPSSSRADRLDYAELVPSYFVRVYQDSPSGSLSCLLQLAKHFVNVIPTYPQLTNDLASICQLASDIMADACSLHQLDNLSKTRKRLEIGHALYEITYRTLDNMIDKKPTQLVPDSILKAVQALSDIIKLSLEGDHNAATSMIQEHRTAFPAAPHDYTIEAIACEQRFHIFIKLIRSSQMQLRFQGAAQMCNDLIACWKDHSDRGRGGSLEHIEHLADYLIRTGFIDYFLGSNCHPEITVEGANIVGFIIVTKKCRQEHIDMVWQGITSGQDPRTADALTRMVASISHLFDNDGLLAFCKKFQTLPVDAFTPAIRAFWENLMKLMIDKSTIDQPLGFQPYGICLRLLRESSACTTASQVMYPEMQQAAMQKFRELLRFGPDPEGRQQLYLDCIEDIVNKSDTTLGSLWCLFTAIRSRNMPTELHALVQEHGLTTLIVQELEHAIEAGRSAETQMVLSSPINQPRRDFISSIIQLEPQTITQDLGPKLWAMLVGPLALSLDDRRVGWEILNNANRRTPPTNPFLQTCLSQFLPKLSSQYFCEGMLEFLRADILPRLNEKSNLALDDQEAVSESGIEQLWRLVLEAGDEALVERSIRTLAVDIYIENRYIASNTVQRTRSIHLILVSRCLKQLKDAAKKLNEFRQNLAGAGGQLETIAFTSPQQRPERIFIRSLKFLRYILEAHQSKPHLSAPDLRTLILQMPYEIQGDSAGLKYQSFDGNQQTDIKPLVIGKENTAASLLASLRQETGFENYRVYYRGQPFLPSEHDICKSLTDLRVHDGLILVRREEAGPALTNRVRPGASPLEIEISRHFEAMWEYLSMEEALAQEIYHFLVKLPTNGHFSKLIDNNSASYDDIFPRGQPFKSLYAIHALIEYTGPHPHGVEGLNIVPSTSESGFAQYSKALETAVSFVVQAISDENVFDGASMFLRLKLTCGLLHAFRQFLDRIDNPTGPATSKDLAIPEPARLVEILSYAVGCPGEVPSPAVAGALVICLRLSMLNDAFWTKLSTNPDFALILQRLLLTDPRHAIRSISAKLIEELFNVVDHTPPADELSIEISTENRGIVLTKYFWTISRAPESFDIITFTSRTSQLLLEHTTTETIDSPGVEDAFARGLSSLLHLCLQLDGSIAQSGTLPGNLAMLLFSQHLYPPKCQDQGQPVPRVVLHEETRSKLCEVVFSLVKHDRNKMKEIVHGLYQQVPFFDDEEDDDTYLYDLTYHFDRLGALRAPCGYVGLQNLSNTCYLNSLLTQLYMNTGFRRFVLNCQVSDPATNQQLLFYTQKLFGHMQGSYLRFIDPSNFVNSVKTYDDTLIDIHNQMDVDEFYNLLFDRWEGQLYGDDEKKMMKSFYGGQLVQQVKSKECEHISERLEPFSAIQCDIKGKTTLIESLQAYVGGEIMEGETLIKEQDNKYKCSMCDRHVDAVKRACLKDVPDNLIFHLKRFDFNLRTLQRSKINDYFSFPEQVDMRPYTIEHLSDPENDTEEDIFELVGVLVHSGTAESGHYYSYIRERPSSANRPTWVEFNDDMVTPWDSTHMEYSTFGGAEHRTLYDTNGIVCDKNYSAYMLFYQRASSLRVEQDEMTGRGIPAPLRVPVPDDLDDHILAQNTVILRRHCIYDQSNIRLVQWLFHQSQQHCKSIDEVDTNQSINTFLASFQQDHGLQDLAMQTLVGNLDQVVTRTNHIPDFQAYSKTVLDAITSCQHCAFSYYRYFDQHPGAFRTLLQRNPDPGVRSFISKSFIAAVARISQKLPQVYDQQVLYSPVSDLDSDELLSGSITSHRSVIDGVMILLDHLWKFFYIHIRAWDEYFGTILGFAQLGRRETGCVLAADFLAKTIQIISADPLQDLDGEWARMLHNVLRRNNTRQTSYAAIIALAHHLMVQMDSKIGPEFNEEEPTERLLQSNETFSWTSVEAGLVYNDLSGSHTSLFIEKLLSLDQAQAQSDRIIHLLVILNTELDDRILATLKQCIRGETSTQIMDPFLRAAATYIESTDQLGNAREMIDHISLQAKSLQNTEGVYFVRFFLVALNLKQQDDRFTDTVRSHALNRVPDWVPYLLASQDRVVRANTETFLVRALFDIVAETTPNDEGDGGGSWVDRDMIKQTTKHVGIACLKYLREQHVSKLTQVNREVANLFLKMVGQCAEAVNTDPNTQTELDLEFLEMQDDVLTPLNKLMVDEMEEDGSGMLQSFSDSDTITADLGDG